MAYHKDLREYLQALGDAGELIRIRGPINKDTAACPRNVAKPSSLRKPMILGDENTAVRWQSLHRQASDQITAVTPFAIHILL